MTKTRVFLFVVDILLPEREQGAGSREEDQGRWEQGGREQGRREQGRREGDSHLNSEFNTKCCVPVFYSCDGELLLRLFAFQYHPAKYDVIHLEI